MKIAVEIKKTNKALDRSARSTRSHMATFSPRTRSMRSLSRGASMEFERPDLPCSICGQPGKLRHYPGPVPVSSTYCDEHYAFLQRGYDETIDAPYRYFTGPTERDDTDSDVTAFYEFHGEWCVRQVEQFDGNTYKSERDEDWATVCEIPLMEIDPNDPDYPLSEITKADFERVWCAPTTHPQ